MKKSIFLLPGLFALFFQIENLQGSNKIQPNNLEGKNMNNSNNRLGRRGGLQNGTGKRKLDGTGPRSKSGECLKNNQNDSVMPRLGGGRGLQNGTGKRKLDGTGPRSKSGECPKSEK